MANDSLAMQAMSAPFRVAAAGGRMWWAGVRGMFNMGVDGREPGHQPDPGAGPSRARRVTERCA